MFARYSSVKELALSICLFDFGIFSFERPAPPIFKIVNIIVPRHLSAKKKPASFICSNNYVIKL